MSDEKKDESKLARAGRVALEEIAASKALGSAIDAQPVPSILAALAKTGASPSADAATAPLKALVEETVQRGAALLAAFRPRLAERDEQRVNAGLLAAAEARGGSVEDLVALIDRQKDDEWTQTWVRETLRAMIEALDPTAVAPLGRLLADYLGPPRRAPDLFLRGFARFVADSSAEDLRAAHTVLAQALAAVPPAAADVAIPVDGSSQRILGHLSTLQLVSSPVSIDRALAERMMSLLGPA